MNTYIQHDAISIKVSEDNETDGEDDEAKQDRMNERVQ